MNYRHAFHAGNFADVVKHAVLARIVLHLRKKEAAFRIIDTHAGAGLYDLAAPDASRSGEWREGIARLLTARLAPAPAALLAPYLEAIRAFNPDGKLTTYPGSPALARSWLRPQDRLVACELEPGAARALARNLRGDKRVKAIAIDGWMALAAYIPPRERRGIVLIDPPFEQRNEYPRLADALIAAQRKWPDGIFLAWYPIKAQSDIADFRHRLARAAISKMLRVELILAAPPQTAKLRGTGLIVCNPPWTLEDELKIMLPALAKALGPGGRGQAVIAPIGPKPR